MAGTVNTIVGSGSLLTFPTLVGLGYSPLVANVSNKVGLVPGAMSGTVGYRQELVGQRDRAIQLGLCSIAGGLSGGVLLLVFPSAFEAVVPWLVILAVGIVVLQPRISRFLADHDKPPRTKAGWPLRGFVFLVAIYGGYFGAAQGVMVIGLLALGLDDTLQRLNGLKNAMVSLVNGAAGVVFLIAAPVAWLPALLIALSSILGGQVGARVGRRLPAQVLRGIIVVAGVAVAVKLLI